MSNINQVATNKRLEKIIENEVLSLRPDQGFDNLCNLAAGIFEVDNASITFIGDEILTIAKCGTLNLSDDVQYHAISAVEQEETFLLKDDSEWAFLIAVPIKTVDGVVIGLISVFATEATVITNNQVAMLKRLPDVISEKLAFRTALRNTMRAQDDRLHVLIHDLKNPMTTVSLQSELIGRMPNIDDKVALISGKINMQAKKIVDHLNDILSSARKEKGSFKPQKEKIAISDILNNALQSLQPALVNKNISTNMDTDACIEIYGDKKKLEIVFYELLQNAIKFAEVSGEIRISYQVEDHLTTIAINDTGVGLTAEDLNHLFIKFANLSSKPTAGEYSNGLGLTLAKMYIDVHKGKLWAESAGKNKGATFFVQLPIK